MKKENENSSKYKVLDAKKLTKTIEILKQRIHERFPNSSLEAVCGELLDISKDAHAKILWINRPSLKLRFAIAIPFFAVLSLPIYSIYHIKFNKDIWEFGTYVQSLDGITNLIMVLGFVIFFFFKFESRVKTKRALSSLKELKTLAHVIDMHQLTKDPHKVMDNAIVLTKSSPRMDMDAKALIRYLDYCTEMLSLIGKIAVLYGQYLEDAQMNNTVNEIETMTTQLSRKIWQKIMILNIK